MSWLNKFFRTGMRQTAQAGTLQPAEPTINFVSGATVVDNPTTGMTDVTISATGGPGQATNTLTNGLNSNVPMHGLSTLRFAGPTAAFSVGGFSPTSGTPPAGFVLTVINTTAQPMTIVDSDAGSTYPISTGSSGPVTLPPRQGACYLLFDGTSNKWQLQNGGLLYGTFLNVRDFGAKGDGVTDDTSACQTALTYAKSIAAQFNGVLPPFAQFPAGYNSVTVFFPRGAYVLSAPSNEACLEVSESVSVLGEGYGTMLVPSTSTAHAMRFAGLYQNIRDISFIGGKCACVFNGPSRYYGGSLGSVLYQSTVTIHGCFFSGQAGPSIYLDTTIQVRDASYCLMVEKSNFVTSCAFYGIWDVAGFRDCYVQVAQNSSPWPVALDDNGVVLPFWCNMGTLTLDHVIGVPTFNDTLSPKSAWMAGFGVFWCQYTRFGGETEATIARVTTSLKFNGQTMATLFTATGGNINRPVLHFDQCALSSAFGHNWLEIYNVFPQMIDVRQIPPTVETSGSLPSPVLVPMLSHGIWVDSVSCPQSTYVKVAREAIFINFDEFTSGPDFRIRTSSDPSLTLGQSGVIDITPRLRKFMTGEQADRGKRPTLSDKQNIWPTAKLSLADADTVTAPGLATGGTDSSTGYTIQGFHVTGAAGFMLLGFNNVLSGMAAPGEYTIAFMVKAQFAGQVVIALTDATGATNGLVLDTLDFSDGDWQRLETTFYWDGTTYSGGSGAGIQFQFSGMPATLDVYGAFFTLSSGREAAAWHYPGNVTQSGYVNDCYYAITTPVAGTYKLGDTIWNTNTVVGQPAGWKCIRGGKYGGALGTAPLWSSFGTLNFDPSQISTYNFDYDAAVVAPSTGSAAITTWPSKYGGSFPAASYQLSGTATAHATGGPNNLPYVSFNGTTDTMHEGNQSSAVVANELYLVFKYDTTGGSAGTLWDGGVGNDGRIYRTGVHTITLFTGGASGTTSSDEVWAIWHIIADGTTTTLEVAESVVATASSAAVFNNGVTAGNFGAGGSANACSFARAIGFVSPGGTGAALTSAQRTSMLNYLKTIYQVT